MIIPDKLGNNPLHRMRNRIAAEILEEQWKVNYQVNRKYLDKAVPFSSLTNENDSAIAIIVGAGPSLQQNLKDLVHFPSRENVVFFCTDKAFPKMAAIGTEPNYVCALNAKSPNKEVTDWWKQGRTTARSTLIMPLTADPITLEGWQGKYCFINVGLPIDLTDRILSETGLNPIPGGTNIGIFSYLMASRLGYQKMVLIGMDYSFETREQVVSKYPPGEPYIIMEHRDKEGHIRWSSWDWFDSAVAFFEYARFFGKNGIRTVNCFPAGTLINAPIPSTIETFPPVVFGDDGQAHPTLHTYSRPYNGPMVRIKARSIPELDVTPEHPFLCIPFSKVLDRHETSPKETKQRIWRDRVFHARSNKPQWLPASHLRLGDVLLSTNTNSGCTGGYVSIPSHRGQKKLPKRINLTKDIAWLIGLYVADGGRYDNNSTSIAFSDNQSVAIERARKILLDDFWIEPQVIEYDRYALMRIHSASLVDTLTSWCGKTCYEKHLPEFLVGSSYALDGVLEGDGYEKNEQHSITTVSPSLALQLHQTLLNKFEYPYLRKFQSSGYHQTIPRPHYQVCWNKNVHNHHTRWYRYSTEPHHKYGQKFLFMPITSIQQMHYDGPVFNLEVEKTNTYMAYSAICHNCTEGGIVYDGEFVEAMTMEEAGRALYP